MIYESQKNMPARWVALLLFLFAPVVFASTTDDIGGYIRGLSRDAILDGKNSFSKGRQQYERLSVLQAILAQRSDQKALAEVETLAAAGNPAAINFIGWMLDRGKGGLPQDSYKAAAYFRAAAAKGDSNGYYNLSLLLFAGRGVKQDRTLAETLLKKAEILDNKHAAVRLGILAEERGAFGEAVTHYGRSIWGITHDFAIYRFGMLTFRGPVAGSKPNPKDGITQMVRAANLWNPDAQATLVEVYGNGLLVAKDPVQAGKWLEALNNNSRRPLRSPVLPNLSEAELSQAKRSYAVWRTWHVPTNTPSIQYDTTITSE